MTNTAKHRKTPKVSQNKHFEFTKAVHPRYPEVRQIRATRNLPYLLVSKGDVGGWITCEENLEGGAWVGGSAVVLGETARVRGDALVKDRAVIRNGTVVEGFAMVSDDAHLDNCMVRKYAKVHGQTLGTSSDFSGGVSVRGVGRLSVINSKISGMSYVQASGYVKSNSVISDGHLTGRLEILNGNIDGNVHVLTMGPLGSENCTAQLYRTLTENNGYSHTLKIGCWDGHIDDLAAELDRRKEDEWYADEDTMSLWMAQYAGLSTMVRATIKLWEE